MNSPRKPPGHGALDKPYVRGDLIPIPEAVESDSDTAWDAFSALQAKQEAIFADTAPASIPMPLPSGDPRYAKTQPAPLKADSPRQARPAASRRGVTLDDAMQEARRNNRVCPKPAHWQRLYDSMPADAGGKRPAPPLTGAAWSGTPSLSKRMSFRAHLEWAGAHGALDRLMALMKELPEDDWHHMGD
jgi:hypothetical protein